MYVSLAIIHNQQIMSKLPFVKISYYLVPVLLGGWYTGQCYYNWSGHVTPSHQLLSDERASSRVVARTVMERTCAEKPYSCLLVYK